MADCEFIEKEIKRGVDENFRMPVFKGIEGLIVGPREGKFIRVTYWDDHEGSLAREGWTVRWKARSTEGEGEWTVKVPISSIEGLLERREVVFAGRGETLLERAKSLLPSVVQVETMEPVARMEKNREAVKLWSDLGELVCEVALDKVTVKIDTKRVIGHFWEVEIEEGEGADQGLIDEVDKILLKAGAQEKLTKSKYQRVREITEGWREAHLSQ